MRPLAFGAALAALVSGMAFADVPPPPPDATPVQPSPAPTGEAPKPDEAPLPSKAEVLAVKETDVGLGDPNAPVKWIEYASAGCPHCADLSLKILPQLKADYIDSGKVYYVLRDFPLDNVAAAATVLARCVPREIFYPFMEKLFADQAKWHSPDVADIKGAILTIAAGFGLDEAAADACLKRQDLLDQVVKGMTEAEKVLQVGSTPTSFIGDETVVGTVSVGDFKAALDKALGVPSAGGSSTAPSPTPEQSKPAPEGTP